MNDADKIIHKINRRPDFVLVVELARAVYREAFERFVSTSPANESLRGRALEARTLVERLSGGV